MRFYIFFNFIKKSKNYQFSNSFSNIKLKKNSFQKLTNIFYDIIYTLQLFPLLHIERWAFDVELLFLAEQFNIPIREVPVTWHEVDGSKIVPVISWIQMGRDLILIWFRYRTGVWKHSLL